MSKKIAGTVGCLRNNRIAAMAFVFGLSGLLYLAHLRNKSERIVKDPIASGPCPTAGDSVVTHLLLPIRQEYKIPAIAGAIVTGDGIVSVGAVGVRKAGVDIPVTLEDKWHLGSETKAMTATLVARLVEQDRMRWDMRVGEVFKDLASSFDPEMNSVTLLHLLSHRAGLARDLDVAKFRGRDGRKERFRSLIRELAKKPRYEPGSEMQYSNLGYIVAGAMIEKLTDKAWAQAMQDEVFTPLEMTSVGFGGTGTRGHLDQPWGHYEDGRPAYGNGPSVDNPPVMGPAGRIHCTIQDWAKFIKDQLRGSNGESALLKKASYQTLQTPPFGGDYALGWGVTKRTWGGGTVLSHSGSNTMNFAVAWVAPQRNFAVLICTNQGGEAASKASDAAASALIKEYNSRI